MDFKTAFIACATASNVWKYRQVRNWSLSISTGEILQLATTRRVIINFIILKIHFASRQQSNLELRLKKNRRVINL